MRLSEMAPKGWRLLFLITACLAALVVAVAFQAPDAVEGVRAAIRLTARTSLILFSLAFIASSVNRLMPGAASRWLLQNRRYLGLGFAVSHLFHAAALVRLALIDPVLFDSLTTPVSFIAGGFAYLVILSLAATSFDRTRNWIGTRLWARLHGIGMWIIWAFFLINFGKRAVMNGMYWPAMTIIFLALAIRLLGRERRIKGSAGEQPST